jgi:hypothetical protein
MRELKFCTGSPRCKVCGAPHPADRIQNCPFPHYDPAQFGCGGKTPKNVECPHLGEPTDKSVRVYGCGCASEIVLTQIWTCDLHGTCSPFPKGKSLADETLMRCKDCADNPTADQGD